MATTILADGAAILTALSQIQNSTTALNDTVTAFQPGLAGLTEILPLLSASTALLTTINSATSIASSSANLTSDEAISVAGATQSLALAVNTTLANVIRTKPKYDTLLVVSPVVLLNLKLEQEATDRFGDAVVAKVPVELQGVAGLLLAPIDASFAEAIAVYE
ncbi:hypothetical protein LOCC1_G006362 [Lachnellula occidentalis]|uniref:Uncharacterized protein n=1 Tax=Lachnellula occidentalis TaxID=215460 RepID=A0A8H8RUF1_9HELO|nr:hypothetical protein LOCC1_G006362 [Lachnellula occidentalis]